ncbi:MAG: hypothetical protein GTN53_08130 [Candidatus Aminicenantes bacterium]|nr:hypothetical protein [Candidatus Aminicenantes bacterium]NIQ66423.1 hypothetical protein [Candidatus Aminicenantes bacterium]NIT22456.1 hypothetical protein [Candidatus Aminicenantes bacterium]
MELKKDRRLARLEELKEEELCVKVIADLIGVKPGKVYYDIAMGYFKNAEKSGPGKRARIEFTKAAVKEYIESFPDTSQRVEELPSKRLEIPGWDWDSL